MAKKKNVATEHSDINAEVVNVDVDKFNEEFAKTFTETYKCLGLTQKKLRIMTGKSVGYINNIAKGKISPSVAFMRNLLGMEPFSNHGLIIDDFVAGDPVDVILNKTRSSNKTKFIRKDMVGSYMVYLFDQSKENFALNERASRRIRFGVISIVEEVGFSVNFGAQSSFKAYSQFFKEKNDAVKFHKNISKIFKTSLKCEKIDIPELDKSIKKEYDKVGVNPSDPDYNTYRNKEYYEGKVDFQEQHVYIDLKSDYFGDHALFALYSPPKKKDSDYIGGIASLCSVSHGKDRMPCAQKALVSRYVLNKDDVEIGEYIRMNPTKVSIGSKMESIYSIFEEFNKENLSKLIDKGDKLSILSGRFERIVQDYIEDGLNSVGVITTDDDAAAYELIKHFGIHND